ALYAEHVGALQARYEEACARFGFDALGGLLAGFVASWLGAGHTLLVEGGALLLFVVFLFTRRQRLLAQVAEARGDSSHGH
ncbi:MAG: hypothetical protein F9K30_23925, partial [Dechloromonas sp.]